MPNKLPVARVSIIVMVERLCGSGVIDRYEFEPAVAQAGSVMVWTGPDVEVAIGLPLRVFEPELLEHLKGDR